MDMFARTSPGDPINGDPAELYNLLIDVAQDWLRNRRHMSPPKDLKLPSQFDVLLRNTAESALDQFSIVRLGNPVNVPRSEDQGFYGHAVFDAAAPAEGKTFGVLQLPITTDAIARVVFMGQTLARVNFTDLAHEYANQIVGDMEKLLSQAAPGPARVQWKNTPANSELDGGIDAGDTTLDVPTEDASSWPSPGETGNYVIEIDSEQMLVTGRQGTTLTVTRGHNSTTAASHSDGATVTFKSGVLWALILLCPHNSGEEGEGDCECCEPCECEAFELTGPNMEDPDTWIEDTWTSPDCKATVMIQVNGPGGQGGSPGEGAEGSELGGGGGGCATGRVTLAPNTDLLLELQATSLNNPTGPAVVRVSGIDVNGDAFEIYAESGTSGLSGGGVGGSAGGTGITDLVTHTGGDAAITGGGGAAGPTHDGGDASITTGGLGYAEGTSGGSGGDGGVDLDQEEGEPGESPGGGSGAHYAPDDDGSPHMPLAGGHGRIRITCVPDHVQSLNGQTGPVTLSGRGVVVSTQPDGTIELEPGLQLTFGYGDATPEPVGQVPANAIVDSVRIVITQAFNGTGPALTVGDAGDPDRLMTAASSLPSEAGTYETSPGHKYSSATNLNLYITPGAGATQGAGIVVVTFKGA